MPRPQIIAHRGASGEAPENTLAAFRRALAIGVDAVELDVHLSADGEPVIIHDPVLARTTDGSGLVSEHTTAALRRLDAGRWFAKPFAGERIPSLAEALDVLRPVGVLSRSRMDRSTIRRSRLESRGSSRRRAIPR
jgi:glycerophosphoryl diester phosphodiesterase